MVLPPNAVHPEGEADFAEKQPLSTAIEVETFAGKVHVEWDPTAAVTPIGQLPFFIEFLKLGHRFNPWVEDCPLHYVSNNAPRKIDVLGSLFLSILSGHNRYAHIGRRGQVLQSSKDSSRLFLMARPLRIEYAGALYHVTSRGDRREDIYHDDEDRLTWLDVFAQVCARFNWRCHSWCLMDNHYHILIETAEGNLSQGMRQLNGVYTQKSNRRHDRVGHVFQGRYKAILVQKDAYLLELSRYVVLNPVRAGMVKDPQEWPWSSYGSMIGKSPAPTWLETDWILACFGKQRKRARAKYIDFVRAGIGLPPIWEDLKYQMYLGSDDFVKSMRHKLDGSKKEDLREISRLQRRPMAKPLQWYEENTAERKQAMALAYVSGDYTMKEISEWFCVHYSTVSRAVKLFEVNA